MYLLTNNNELVMQARETCISIKECSNEKFCLYERVCFGTFDKNKCCIYKSDYPALSIFQAKLRSVIRKDSSNSKQQEIAAKLVLIVVRITYTSIYVKICMWVCLLIVVC